MKNSIKRTILIAATILFPFAIPYTANAAVIVTIQEVGSDLLISGSGTLDISTWAFETTSFQALPNLSDDAVSVGASANVDRYSMPANFSGPMTISTMRGAPADSGTGDAFQLFWVDETGGYLPQGYVSGSPLSGTATFLNESLADFNLTVGQSFTWTWDTASAGTDSFTLNVIPEPSSAVLMGLGALGLGLIRRRQKR